MTAGLLKPWRDSARTSRRWPGNRNARRGTRRAC